MQCCLTVGPVEFGHSLVSALGVVDMGIVTRVPLVHVLVETIDPVGGSRQVNDLFLRNGMRNKLGNWVADEHVGLFDVAPEIVPDIILWRSVNGNEIASDLDVRSVEDRAIRSESLDHRDKPRHLGIIDLYRLLAAGFSPLRVRVVD